MPLVMRADLWAGQAVLVLGATGVAGMLAVQFARHLGAGRVMAAGRDTRSLTRLADLGADAVVRLDQPRDDVASGIADAAGRLASTSSSTSSGGNRPKPPSSR